ncbi:MAG: sialate O-acetylesterase [bacterium]
MTAVQKRKAMIVQRILALPLALTAAICSGAETQTAARADGGLTISQPLEVIVLAGQSNAQGWMGDGRKYPAAGQDARIPFRWMIPGHNAMRGGESQRGAGWGTLGPQNGICGYGNPVLHFGPEVGLARTLAQAGRHVAVIKVTIGATSLNGDWRLPGQGGFTDAMLAEVKQAMADLARSGRKARLRGFVWIQGESDADTDPHAQGYRVLLTKFVAGLRREWREPELAVVLGMDEQHPGPVARPQVVEAQKAIARADRHAAFVSMRGLPKADVSHLTNDGLLQHGERIAGALQGLLCK